MGNAFPFHRRQYHMFSLAPASLCLLLTTRKSVLCNGKCISTSLCGFIQQSALWPFYAANCWASLWWCRLVGVLLSSTSLLHAWGVVKDLALVVIFLLGGRTLNPPIIFSPHISPVVSHTQSLALFLLLWLTFTTLDCIMVQWHTRRVLGFDPLLPCSVSNMCLLSLMEWLPCVI